MKSKENAMVHLGNDWDDILLGEFDKEYYLKIREVLKTEYFSRTVFPPMNDIFNALKYTSFANTKVVILGQDPYHEIGQAHGLSFSVRKGIKIPPSLVNDCDSYSIRERDAAVVGQCPA
jgi:uracil-DNA glycosylase